MKKKVLSLLAFLPAFTTVMAQQTAEVPYVHLSTRSSEPMVWGIHFPVLVLRSDLYS
jgi:hypothetical protein